MTSSGSERKLHQDPGKGPKLFGWVLCGEGGEGRGWSGMVDPLSKRSTHSTDRLCHKELIEEQIHSFILKSFFWPYAVLFYLQFCILDNASLSSIDVKEHRYIHLLKTLRSTLNPFKIILLH